MKKTPIILLTIIAILVVGGCRNTDPQTAQSNATSNTSSPPVNAAKPAASPTALPELPKSDLKPEDVSLDKLVLAEELRNAAFGDEQAWKGKEVTVIGNYNGHSTSKLSSGDKYSLNVQGKEGKVVIKCDGKTAPPADLKDKRDGRVFKGTVKELYKPFQQVTLEPCEVIK